MNSSDLWLELFFYASDFELLIVFAAPKADTSMLGSSFTFFISTIQ
jgi:hypothetical protein